MCMWIETKSYFCLSLELLKKKKIQVCNNTLKKIIKTCQNWADQWPPTHNPAIRYQSVHIRALPSSQLPFFLQIPPGHDQSVSSVLRGWLPDPYKVTAETERCFSPRKDGGAPSKQEQVSKKKAFTFYNYKYSMLHPTLIIPFHPSIHPLIAYAATSVSDGVIYSTVSYKTTVLQFYYFTILLFFVLLYFTIFNSPD